ncbi:hypothetical protein EPN95_04610 [Patescibacteria group bacterium]|nr:MAG: hypothetical protein EPN95_04610 [Patescibacteria group bacterium]
MIRFKSKTANRVSAVDGTAAAPSISFSGDAASGMYLISTNNIGWSTAGGNRLTLSTGAFQLNGVNFIFATDSLNDIGASGASRPRDLFLGRKLFLDFTNTGTVGNVTMNKPSGRVNIAAAGTTFTVTNSFVTAASHVLLTFAGNPGNSVVLYAVPAAGSFTVNVSAAITNQTAIDFVVLNAD